MILFTVTFCANPANNLTCPPHILSFKNSLRWHARCVCRATAALRRVPALLSRWKCATLSEPHARWILRRVYRCCCGSATAPRCAATHRRRRPPRARRARRADQRAWRTRQRRCLARKERQKQRRRSAVASGEHAQELGKSVGNYYHCGSLNNLILESNGITLYLSGNM